MLGVIFTRYAVKVFVIGTPLSDQISRSWMSFNGLESQAAFDLSRWCVSMLPMDSILSKGLVVRVFLIYSPSGSPVGILALCSFMVFHFAFALSCPLIFLTIFTFREWIPLLSLPPISYTADWNRSWSRQREDLSKSKTIISVSQDLIDDIDPIIIDIIHSHKIPPRFALSQFRRADCEGGR